MGGYPEANCLAGKVRPLGSAEILIWVRQSGTRDRKVQSGYPKQQGSLNRLAQGSTKGVEALRKPRWEKYGFFGPRCFEAGWGTEESLTKGSGVKLVL